MYKKFFSFVFALVAFFASASASFAWTTPLYQPIGYTSGAWDLRSTGYECSYWCQLDTGTVMIYGDNLAARVPGVPTSYGSVAQINSYLPQSYGGQNAYDAYGQFGMGPQSGLSQYDAYAPMYGYGYAPLYVGPRGGNTYATSGYYPYVASRPYVGF